MSLYGPYEPLVVLGIDPGTERSGWVLFDGARVLQAGVSTNYEVLMACYSAACAAANACAIEEFVGMGQPGGSSTLTAARWAGRFEEAWRSGGGRAHRQIAAPVLVTRLRAKTHLRDRTGTMPIGDAGVRRQLIQLFGDPGRKASPGPTYGVTSHAWSALAVAFAAWSVLRAACGPVRAASAAT